jgi:hypothetical protein
LTPIGSPSHIGPVAAPLNVRTLLVIEPVHVDLVTRSIVNWLNRGVVDVAPVVFPVRK